MSRSLVDVFIRQLPPQYLFKGGPAAFKVWLNGCLPFLSFKFEITTYVSSGHEGYKSGVYIAYHTCHPQ
jgi:hypothetical protein